MKKKKIIIITTSIVLAAAAIGTGIYFTVKSNSKKHTVETTMIDNVSTYASDMMETSLSGSVFSGGGQNVYISEDDVIDKILVNEGDSVQPGTPIIALDSNKLKLDLDSCNLAVQQDDLKLQVANKTLQKYQTAVPRSENSEPEEPDMPDIGISTDNILSEISNISQAFEGDGSMDNPYKFKCYGNSVIHASLFKSIETENKYTTLYIYSEDIGDFAYTCILSPSGKNISIDDNYSWKVGNIYTLADGTETIQLNKKLPKIPCEFSSYTPEYSDDEPIDDTDGSDEPDEDGDTVPESIDGVYTQQELSQMISEKQKEIAELTIQKKDDELAAKKAQTKYNKATITSTVNGVVTSIDSSATGSDPVMVISDSAGLYVKTVIDEYSYSDVSIGDEINVMAWTESGDVQTTAKITSISPYPVSSANEYAYTSNKNVSFYPVVAQLENSEGITNDDYVSVSFSKSSEDDSEVIGIDKAYIGDDNGKKFLYLVDDKGYLKKTYITTGKTLYDSYLEIKDEIDTSGYIASPYTKYAKDGAKAKLSDAED